MELTDEEGRRWDSFHQARNDRDREWLIHHYTPMVEAAVRVFRNVRAQDIPDLRGAGFVGLIQSVDAWDPSRMPWLEFCRFKIRAACIDHIRSCSWVPKSVRALARKVEGAEERLAAELGRPPTTEELAREFKAPVEQMQETLTTIRGTDWMVSSIDHTIDGEGSWLEALSDPAAESPEETAVRREDLDALELILQRLPERLRRILRWRYFQYPRMSQKQIAAELKIHESRVSQLLDKSYDLARKLALQPGVLFPEIFLEEERLTCRD